MNDRVRIDERHRRARPGLENAASDPARRAERPADRPGAEAFLRVDGRGRFACCVEGLPRRQVLRLGWTAAEQNALGRETDPPTIVITATEKEHHEYRD
jgi:hypothetical protein